MSQLFAHIQYTCKMPADSLESHASKIEAMYLRILQFEGRIQQVLEGMTCEASGKYAGYVIALVFLPTLFALFRLVVFAR